MNSEKAQKVRNTIAEVVGFDAEDIQDEDRFIADYRISYPERKTLLDRLNTEFGKNLEFDSFCKLDLVGAVIHAFEA